MNNIIIIDHGMGNLRSVYNKYRKLNVNCEISSDINKIKKADKLILPGVGHYKYAMHKLNELNLIVTLNKKVIKENTPILGICLGAQLFSKHSEEGDCDGLGWIDSKVVRFNVDNKVKYKVPHMGWNNIQIKKNTILNSSLAEEEQFYFVHSYHLIVNDINDVWMTTKYDYEFVSAINRENIFGTQFHPEKSHDAGFELLKKFAEL